MKLLLNTLKGVETLIHVRKNEVKYTFVYGILKSWDEHGIVLEDGGKEVGFTWHSIMTIEERVTDDKGKRQDER